MTRSKAPGSTGPAVMSPCRNSSPGECTSTSERSRSNATARPPGATRCASHAEIEPLPQPTSSVWAPGGCQAIRCTAGALDRAIATSAPGASLRLPDDDSEHSQAFQLTLIHSRNANKASVSISSEALEVHSWLCSFTFPRRRGGTGRRAGLKVRRFTLEASLLSGTQCERLRHKTTISDAHTVNMAPTAPEPVRTTATGCGVSCLTFALAHHVRLEGRFHDSG